MHEYISNAIFKGSERVLRHEKNFHLEQNSQPVCSQKMCKLGKSSMVLKIGRLWNIKKKFGTAANSKNLS